MAPGFARLWARRDSNPGPTDYESVALTTELRARLGSSEFRDLVCFLQMLIPVLQPRQDTVFHRGWSAVAVLSNPGEI